MASISTIKWFIYEKTLECDETFGNVIGSGFVI
jgi:hypothetical protein